jgi:hypothetical protein
MFHVERFSLTRMWTSATFHVEHERVSTISQSKYSGFATLTRVRSSASNLLPEPAMQPPFAQNLSANHNCILQLKFEFAYSQLNSGFSQNN